MIAALFVAKGGCYYGLPDVDPWDDDTKGGDWDEWPEDLRVRQFPAREVAP